MKRFTRVVSLVLVLVLLVSNLAILASAYDVNSGSSGCATSRTYKVYHTWGTAVKLSRYAKGTARDVLGTSYSCYGKYTYTVKNSSGKQIASGTWYGDRNSSATLVGATKSTGYYTITVSAVKMDTTKYPALGSGSYWKTYPKYKISW